MTYIGKVTEKMRGFRGNEKGAIMLIAGIIFAVICIVGLAMIWWIMANLVTIGQGLVYIALAVCMVVATGVLSLGAYRKWIAPTGGGS